MFNSIFKIIYFILFLAVTVMRKIFTAKHRRHSFVRQEKSPGDIALLVFDAIGMIIPMVYALSSWMDFANYELPQWTAWIGTVLFVCAIYMLFLSHAYLGKNWSPVLGIKEEHTLVTSGIYRHIRHPMYAAHLLWAFAQILMLHNWIAGFSFFVVMVPHYLMRVDKEEKMMIDQFGDAYRKYQKSSGRIFPKF